VLLQNIAQAPDEPGPLSRRQARPGAGFKGAPRRADCQVDIGFVAGRYLGNRLLRGRVFDGEGLAAFGADPFPIDEHLEFFGHESRGRRAKRGLPNGNGHIVLRAVCLPAGALYPVEYNAIAGY
jgi:hypothetical protein